MEKFEAHMGGEHEHENFERGSGAVQKFAHKEQMRKSAQISDDEQAVCGHEEDYKANDLAGDGDSRDWNPQRISRARERRRTSLEDLQRCDLSRTWPRLDRFEAIARPLPPSSASSTKEPVGPDIERVDTIKSLDQLLLRPNEIALPDDTCGQEGASIQPEITRPAREPERPLGQNFGPNQRPYSPLRRKRTDQWGKAQENRRPPRSRLWDLVFAGLQPGGRLRQERKLPVAITRKKHPANSEPEFSEAEVYRSNVTKLAAQFSHLHNVNTDQTKTRHGWSSRIMFYDVLDSLQREAIRLQEPWSGAKVQPDYHEFRDVLKEVSSDCIQRVILVEDISPSLIDYLGAVFDIPPHVFEEHLDGSGYAGDLSQRSGAARWQNHFPDQGSSSVTWFRPVIPLLPITPELRDDLLQNKRPPIRCVAANCKEKHHICVQTTTNIWRRNMALCPYPGVYHKHSETDYPVGWEERMTICVREFGNCKYTILLLDPLPFARADSRVHARRQKAMQQRLTVVKTSDPFPASQASRTRRGSTAVDHITIENWVTEQQSSLSQDHQPESQVLPPPLEPARNVGATSPPSLPSPANSASSVPLEHPKPRPSGVRFLDPKRPAKTRADWTGTNAGLAGVGFSGVETHSQPTRLGLKRASGGGQYLDSRPSSPSHRKPFAEAHGSLSRDSGSSGPPTIRNNHDRFLLYHPIKAAPSSSAKLGVAITALDIPAYIERLQVPSSTLEKFEASMRNLGKGKETAFDPLRAVFRIIHDDTNSLMDVIEDSLQRIRSDTLDEALLEQRIAFWRKLIHNLNSGLTELDQQLRAFVHFMDDLDSVYFSDSQRGELPSEQLARDTRQTLRSCLGLLERSSMALLTEIQIVDSRRSIAEAESISKLTELAFVFIPLSFVASLFSMEIRELDGGVPVYIFILAAFATVFIAYSMRLGIRSSRLMELKDRVKLQIRSKAHVPHNRPIPTHVFLRWVCSITVKSLTDSTIRLLTIFSPLLFSATLIAAILAPLIALWLRSIDKGFTAIITLLILPLDAVFVITLIKSCYKSLGSGPINTFRDLRQRYQKSQKNRTRTKLGKGSADPEAQGAVGSEQTDGWLKRRAPTMSGPSYYLGEGSYIDRVREVSDDTSTASQRETRSMTGARLGRPHANQNADHPSSSHAEQGEQGE